MYEYIYIYILQLLYNTCQAICASWQECWPCYCLVTCWFFTANRAAISYEVGSFVNQCRRWTASVAELGLGTGFTGHSCFASVDWCQQHQHQCVAKAVSEGRKEHILSKLHVRQNARSGHSISTINECKPYGCPTVDTCWHHGLHLFFSGPEHLVGPPSTRPERPTGFRTCTETGFTL